MGKGVLMSTSASTVFGLHDDGSTKSSKPQRKKFMILVLGDKIFAVHLHHVREVISTNQVTILPRMPDYYAGVINLRGRIISTVYLKKSLRALDREADKTHKSKPCIVVTDINGAQYGAFVDDVSEVISVEAGQIDETMNQDVDSKELFFGVLKFSDRRPIPILNLEKAMRIEELKMNHKIEEAG